MAKDHTLEESYKILGIKRKSLVQRVREIYNKYELTVNFAEPEPKLPKVFLFDIETTPMKVFVWGLFGNKYINHQNVIQDWNILSWAGKWLFDDELFGAVLTPDEARSGDDRRITEALWDNFNDADIIIAHNGDRFDIVKMNTRFILNGMSPPNPYKSIDTLKISKRGFKFSSNRLDYLGKLMANKEKIETNFALWTRCMDGEVDALDEMFRYNLMDVELLEDVYLELRPWIKSHPNMALYLDAIDKLGAYACSNCGKVHNANDVVWNGTYSTNVSQFKTFRCDCGAIIRTRKSHKISPLMSVAY